MYQAGNTYSISEFEETVYWLRALAEFRGTGFSYLCPHQATQQPPESPAPWNPMLQAQEHILACRHTSNHK